MNLGNEKEAGSERVVILSSNPWQPWGDNGLWYPGQHAIGIVDTLGHSSLSPFFSRCTNSTIKKLQHATSREETSSNYYIMQSCGRLIQIDAYLRMLKSQPTTWTHRHHGDA